MVRLERLPHPAKLGSFPAGKFFAPRKEYFYDLSHQYSAMD